MGEILISVFWSRGGFDKLFAEEIGGVGAELFRRRRAAVGEMEFLSSLVGGGSEPGTQVRLPDSTLTLPITLTPP